MWHHSGWGNTPKKIFHSKSYPFLQESKQEQPGQGWAGTQRKKPERKWLRPASGCGGFNQMVMPSSLRPHWHHKPRNRKILSLCLLRQLWWLLNSGWQKLIVIWGHVCLGYCQLLAHFSHKHLYQGTNHYDWLLVPQARCLLQHLRDVNHHSFEYFIRF